LMDYLAAVNRRGALGQLMNAFHERYDLLLMPTLPIPAFAAGQETPTQNGHWMDWTPFTYPFNLTQQPAASIPCGLTQSGLPVGLQIVGPRYEDVLVLRASRAFEGLRPFALPDLTRL
jgi:aspartyl-tRNA(Asn)/glutamyl-tRNA(Gln) amidotransferase subunit A